MTTTVNVDKPAAPGWQLAQLPKELSWGQGPIKLSMKDAPANVTAVTANLNRVGEGAEAGGHLDSNAWKVVQKFPVAVVNRRNPERILAAIPRAPTGEMPVGTYRVDWTIHHRRFAEPVKGSKIYRGLEKEPAA